jgi:Rod binding domain-containing protein
MTTPIDNTVLPADVRAAGPKAKELYAAALGFEQLLVRQLAGKLAESAGSEESDGATAMYRQMIPDALAESVTNAGGLGLARQLYDSLKDRA